MRTQRLSFILSVSIVFADTSSLNLRVYFGVFFFKSF